MKEDIYMSKRESAGIDLRTPGFERPRIAEPRVFTNETAFGDLGFSQQ